MHIPSYFSESRLSVLHTLIRSRPFATLVTTRPNGVDADHVPMLLDDLRGPFGLLRGHVARANTVWKDAGDGAEVLVIFHGPESYVSPRWYRSKQETGRVVPTWNYVVVHARGKIAWQHEAGWLRALLEDLTQMNEGAREDAWKVSDAPTEYTDRMLGAIVGFEIQIAAISGKWKLSQNKDPADYAGVLTGLETEAGAAGAEVAAQMRII